MSDNKSTGTSTTTTSMPGMTDAMSYGKGLLTSGAWNPNTTSMVTPFSAQTNTGLNWLTGNAKNAAGDMTQNFQRVSQTLGQGGLNPLQQQQVNRLNPIASGTGLNATQQQQINNLSPIAGSNPVQGSGALNNVQRQGLQGYQSLANMNPVEGMGQLNNVQRGAYDLLNPIAKGSTMSGNPYLEDVIKRSSQDIGNASNLAASAAGRYGSGSHQGVTQDAVGDMTSQLRYQNYGDEANRRDAAIRDLFGMGNQANTQFENEMGRKMAGLEGVSQFGNQADAQYQNAMGRKMGAAGDIFGMGTQGQQQKTDAIGSLFNAGTQQRQNVLGGTQQLSDAYKAMQDPANTMLGVGSRYEDLNSRVLGDQSRVFNERQSAMTDPLSYFANLANSFKGGQQIQTGTEPSNPLGQGIGAGLMGYGATGNPLLGLLGGLGGAFL